MSDWPSVRQALAVAIPEFATSADSRDIHAATAMLDALTAPKTPLAWLRILCSAPVPADLERGGE